MQSSTLEQAKVAEQRADFMERACPGKKAACFVGQHSKMLNFICKKIYDFMKPNQPAFIIPN